MSVVVHQTVVECHTVSSCLYSTLVVTAGHVYVSCEVYNFWLTTTFSHSALVKFTDVVVDTNDILYNYQCQTWQDIHQQSTCETETLAVQHVKSYFKFF